jgi:hypothetical protein
MFKMSQETGMAFEYVVDATLKHADDPIPWGTIGHCVRQTLAYMRDLQAKYPNALVLVNFHNEWDAHSRQSWLADPKVQTKKRALKEVNAQAMRARRWIKDDDVEVSYTSPGVGWDPEQWPEAVIIVDHGGQNEIDYAANEGPSTYDMYTLHPKRGGRWHTLVDVGVFDQYLAGPLPTYFSESKLWVDPVDGERAAGWYGAQSYTTDLGKYEHWVDSAVAEGIHFVVHDEKGMQSVSSWPRSETLLEARLKDSVPPPPPPPPPVEWETKYKDDTVWLQTKKDPGEPEPEPEPGESSEYVNMQRVPDIVEYLENGMNIWAGVRDPNYVLGHCQWAFPTYFDEAEMRSTAIAYDDTINTGRKLIDKLQQEHPNYPGRSQVRKSKLKEFRTHLAKLNSIVNGWRDYVQAWPGAGTYYDSIKGWCEFCNENNIRQP